MHPSIWESVDDSSQHCPAYCPCLTGLQAEILVKKGLMGGHQIPVPHSMLTTLLMVWLAVASGVVDPGPIEHQTSVWMQGNKNLFKVIPAVPKSEKTVKKARYMEHEYTIEEEDLVRVKPTNKPKFGKLRGRREFRSCHGGCVQRDCLPVSDLNVYTECVESCRIICT